MPDLRAALSQHVQGQTPITPPPFTDVDFRARRRSHRRIATIVTVPGVLAATVASAVLASDPPPSRPTAQAPASSPSTQPSADANPTSTPPEPIAGHGALPANTSASCVEPYDLTTLKRRAFAFDGTISRTVPMQPTADGGGPPPGYLTVTFIVHEWFRGGEQTTVTLDMFGPTVSSAQQTSYSIGTRLLVSGQPRWGGSPLQAPIAWGCGFTRYYDQPTAASWRQTFRQE